MTVMRVVDADPLMRETIREREGGRGGGKEGEREREIGEGGGGVVGADPLITADTARYASQLSIVTRATVAYLPVNGRVGNARYLPPRTRARC